MSDAIDTRLRALDPSPADRRPPVAGTDWGREIRAAVTAAPARGRGRGRRWAGVVVTAGAVAAIAALMAVLIVAAGGDDPAPAATDVVLAATPVPGGAPPDAALLDRAAEIVRGRAEILGVEGVTVTPAAGTLVVQRPPGSPEGLVEALTAPGELALYPSRRATYGRPLPTLDAAVRQAQRAAGVAVRGGGLDAVPPGFGVIRADVVRLGDQRPGDPTFTVVRGAPALTQADVAATRVVDGIGGPAVQLDFTDSGAAAFRDLTRTLAQDGALMNALQSVDVVLDGRLITNPVIDHEQHPTGLDGRNGLVIEVPDDLDPAAVAAQVTTGPLPVRLAPVRAVAAPDLLERAYMGLSCPLADDPTCDRVGLSVTLRGPAHSVQATVADRTFPLDDATWSGPVTDGARLVFAGFLERSGLRPDDPAWIGDPEVLVPVELSVTAADGTISSTTTEVSLRPGWG